MKLKHKLKMYKEFGFRVAFASACSSALRWPMAVTRWKDRTIIGWLRHNYARIIRTQPRSHFSGTPQESAPIWSLWWQGEENMPEIVKLCLSSIDRNKGTHPFTLLTKHNFHDYVEMPAHIMKKLDDGVLSLTHFSDIVRMYLLSHYGGLWLDATIYAAKPVNNDIFTPGYFSIKGGCNPKSYAVTMGRWSSFCQGAHKGSMLCEFALRFQLEYWKEHTMPVDYIFIDYVFALAHEEFDEAGRLIDSVPVNNTHCEALMPLLNHKFDAETFNALCRDTTFFKLSWKHDYYKTVSGKPTFYGHLFA